MSGRLFKGYKNKLYFFSFLAQAMNLDDGRSNSYLGKMSAKRCPCQFRFSARVELLRIWWSLLVGTFIKISVSLVL